MGIGNIRTRMTAWFVSALAVVVLLYISAACFFLLRDLRQQLTRHAIQDLETVEGLLYFTSDGRLHLHDDYHNNPESKNVLERLLEVRSPNGSVLFRNDLLGSRSLGDNMLPGEGQGGYSARKFALTDGTPVQMVSRRHVFDGGPAIIRVAFSEYPLWDRFKADLLALILPLPLILAVAAVSGYALASRSLKPIQELAKKAEQITIDRLNERLPVDPSDGELADLARVFNSVLVRLEQSFEQLRRFTSDASHELRTPLAAMRSVGEVGLQKNGTAEGYRDVIGSMLEETNKLTKLVDSLLTIARADSGQLRLNPAEFPARSLATECKSLFDAVLEENGQTLSIQSVGDPMVYGDWLLLRQALVNIVHNAVKYTPKGGEIVLRVRGEGDQVVLEVEDSGPGIPKDKLSRVFDRFYRVEEGRSREAGGAGLGLAIAQWSVEIHQGRVTAFSDEGKGCTFRIALPRLTPPPATSEV